MSNHHGPAVLGIDVGGTTMKARLIGPDDAVLDESRVPTQAPDPDAAALADAVVGLVRHASAVADARGTTVGGIGLVVPGIVEEASGRVLFAVNLGWHDVAVRDVVAAALARDGIILPLALGHDVRAGALAEVSADGHLDPDDVVAFIPVGTGLASGLVVGGRVVSAAGRAGEVGQLRIRSGPHAGCRVEDIASASGLARRCGVPDARAAVDLVRAGDAAACGAWQDCVAGLAEVLAWLTAVAGCSRIIVGGGLAEAGSMLFDPLRAELAARLDRLPPPTVVAARYGDAAGSIGAALLARRLLGAAGGGRR